MTIGDILYTLLIGPLETLFELIYVVAFKVLKNQGLSIVVLSLVMNTLLLPMYRRTDEIQAEANETEKRMKPWVTRIRNTFQGDERFMMLQTYYRQQHYKPTDALKGLTPLMLEIPFFMAAYHFLSNLSVLQHAAFGPIRDLGAPDGLLVIGSLSINLLPILMTVVNLISSAIYTRDASGKTKLQLYLMAGLFLLLLYDCPAGLVLYWTLNNVFSLGKNLLMLSKKPLRLLGILCSVCSLAPLVLLLGRSGNLIRKLLFALIFLAMNLPLAVFLLKKYLPGRKKTVTVTKEDHRLFVTGCLLLTVLLGAVIPSALISTSPEEFLVAGMDVNPNSVYLLHSLLLTAGLFLVWLGLFYCLSGDVWKKRMGGLVFLLCGAAVTDYMFFGKDYGILSSLLIFDNPIQFSRAAALKNLLILLGVVLALAALLRWKRKLASAFGMAAVTAMVLMAAINAVDVQKTTAPKLEQIRNQQAPADQVLHLSKTGKNVMVLMLDRAIGGYVPYIFNEKPELQQQFAGFTYYPNTLTFGPSTNYGLPAVFGGYAYTPLNNNRDPDRSLEEKHNEALKVMPALFDQNNFQVTVCDPTYAGYNWIPDLSIYEDLPGVETHITMGRYNRKDQSFVQQMQWKILMYSMFKASPVALQRFVYDGGRYLSADNLTGQYLTDNLTAKGSSDAFEGSYSVLDRLPELTELREENVNTFQMMCNETAHSPVLLQLPDYEPKDYVDNRDFDSQAAVRQDAQGNVLKMPEPIQVTHYHCNMASYLKLGQWFDWMRENGVYDNTRIILVSDHGFIVNQYPILQYPEGTGEIDLTLFNSLLMVKDFDSREFGVDETLMTTADVPYLSSVGLIESPVNPYLGNPIDMSGKTQPVYLLAGEEFDVRVNNGNTYQRDAWLAFTGENVGDMENFRYAGFGTEPEAQ